MTDTPKPTKPIDEFNTLAQIVRKLNALDPEARKRCLAYINGKFADTAADWEKERGK